jgi:hypothetical protein
VPITIEYDKIEGPSLDVELNKFIRVRTGIVKGIDTGGTVSDANVLEAAYDAVINDTQFGDLSPGGHAPLRRMRFDPVASHNMVKFSLMYDTGSFTSPVAYIYRDSSYLTQATTNMVPGSRKPIRLSWGNPAASADKVPEDLLTISYMRPMAKKSVTALLTGDPDINIQRAVGKVNDGTWANGDAGYWLCTNIDIETRKYTGLYSISVELASKIDEDWSEYGVLFNPKSGKYVKVRDADITTLLGMPYAKGLQYPGGDATKGIVKVGPYDEADFDFLFGTP